MKKIAVFATLLIVAVACGEASSEKESKEKTCKTINDVKIDCADSEMLEKLEKLASDLESMSLLSPEETLLAAEKNTKVMNSINPLMPALEKVIAADPQLEEEFFVSKIYDTKKDLENYNQEQEDLRNIEISASWEQDPKFPKEKTVMVKFKNTSTRAIKTLAGVMTYKDVEGNVLAEDKVDYYSFHFNPESEDELASGYEGTSDRGINVDKDKRALIATVDLVINSITYAE